MIPMVPNNNPAVQVEYKSFDDLSKKSPIWTNFAQVSEIYRESGHNQEISDYLKIRLEKAGFKVIQKEDGTICASKNVNDSHTNAIILQAHMDMVGISGDGNSKKPIELKIKDGWLYANDRTLGADDGIGVAAILAIADDSKYKKYPLEMIITTDEEVGMTGARNLTSDDFYGKYLINLDSEEYGVVIKGCAGISEYQINEKINMQALDDEHFIKISVNISGARGGHSATIKPDTLSPINVLLLELSEIKNLKLVSLSGGERYNAIPRDAKAEFLVPNTDANEIEKTLKNNLEKIKHEKSSMNPNLSYKISAKKAAKGTEYVSSDFQSKMFGALNSIPVGLLSRFEKSASTKTSQNLGVIKIADGNFHVQIMGRSADEKEGHELSEKTSEILSKLFNKPMLVSDKTPIWQPQENSELQKAALKAFVDVTSGEEPVVQVEHGGLEAAIFIEKKPDLDQISIGPTLSEPHSTQERLEIDTVIPFYNWLCKILESMYK